MEEKALSRAGSKNADPPSEAPVVEPSRRRGGGLKRKAASAAAAALNTSSGANSASQPAPSSKRQAKDKNHLAHHPPLHNGPCTRARQSPNKAAAAAAAAAAATEGDVVVVQQKPNEEPLPKESAQSDGGALGGVEPIVAVEESVDLDPVIDKEFEGVRSRGIGDHVVPTPAGWFSWTRVHPLEEHALASFFNGKSEKRTSDIYMEIRNVIMKKFHADPQTQIEPKDLSEISVGDSNARQEIMEFLDHWGLINFHPFPPSDADTTTADIDGPAKTSSLIENLYRFETVQSHPKVGVKADLSAPAAPPRLLQESAISDDLVGPEGPSVEYHCNSCSADCSRKRYHCQKQADFDLCSECYNDGKFGSGMAPADFILMESAEIPGASGGSWTDQETLLLLEALELYGENWNEISEHVATKTKTQCILHFVQMPIEDSFLDSKDEFDTGLQVNMDLDSIDKDSSTPKDAPETKETEAEAKEEKPASSPKETFKPEDAIAVETTQDTGANFVIDALKTAFQVVGSLPVPEGRLSFAEAGNPVMALAAFLAGLVEPNVAAASARNSLKAMSEDSAALQLATRHCFLLEDPPNDRKDLPSSNSAVIDSVDGEARKEECQISDLKGIDASEGSMGKLDENVTAEKEQLVSSQERTELPQNAKASVDGTMQEISPVKESADLALVEVTPSVSKSGDVSIPGDSPPSIVKEPGPITVKESDNLASPKDEKPNLVKESGDLASLGDVTQCSELKKSMEIVSDAHPIEEKEPQQMVCNNSTVETGENTGENDTKVIDNKSEKGCKVMGAKDDHNVDKLRRAAVTALSAAAVKAKLLANQEEDQIQHLVSLLIEKQLHKLESKLAIFTDVEGVVMRIKDQMDRARQRLYHERAQIIAARYGFPSSSPRPPMQPSLPPNRIPMSYVNTGSKPPTMTTPKPGPAAKRTTKTLNAPPTNPAFPNTITGPSALGLPQDKISPIGANLRP